MTAVVPDPGAGGRPPFPAGVRRVREIGDPGPLPLYRHPQWRDDFPWVTQGTTGRGAGDPPFDLGLFRDAPVGPVMERWRLLRSALGYDAAVHAHQVHGTDIRSHDREPGQGLLIEHGADGHVTDRPGLLMTVSVADCVPVFILDPSEKRIALLHGGWRGTAAGIVRQGLEAMGAGDGANLHVHLGPAICGACYEVGPEVHEALGLPVPDGPLPVDVRAVQAWQALEAGVDPDRITVSDHCTRCGDAFFSHRGGDGARQMGVLGIRP